MSHSRKPANGITPAHAELWARIEAFDPDEPGAAVTFSQRLARENGWSHVHALRVIGEYRRFLFLAVTAGHPVSPSDAIDQAWHLHLTYTRSYWETLCGEVLRQPFHHQPTRGGSGERAKFQDWYARTLASYRVAFNELPPADLWPAAAVPKLESVPAHVDSAGAPGITRPSFSEQATRGNLPQDNLPQRNSPRHRPPQFRRVDVSQYWMIPRPRWTHAPLRKRATRALAAILPILATLVIMGCANASGSGPNGGGLFDLRGPEFLRFYLILFPLVMLAAGALRWWLRNPGELVGVRSDEARSASADPYVVAYLAGRNRRVALTALTQLSNSGAIEIINSGSVRVRRVAELPAGSHPVEEYLYQSIPAQGTRSVSETIRSLEPVCTPLEQELENQGWVVPLADRALAKWAPMLLCVTPILLGVIKIGVGIARGKPTGYLFTLCVVSAVLSVFCFWIQPVFRSRRGSQALKTLRTRHVRLRTNVPVDNDQLLPMAVGLFGMGVLTNTALAHIHYQLVPFQQSSLIPGDSGADGSSWSGSHGSSSHSDNSSSSSDSGSSSSDSGGGDSGGGSGCGGCGGGGGGD